MQQADRELIEKILSNDTQAWEFFVVQYTSVIEKAITQTLGYNSQGYVIEEIGEITNDIFLSLLENDYRRLRQFRGDSKLSTWLFRVSENRTKDLLKKQKVLLDIISLEEKDTKELQIPDNRPSIADQLERLEVVRALFTELQDRLSNQEKSFLQLHYFQEKPLSAVAAEMHISIDNIYVIKHRVKNKGGEILNEFKKLKKIIPQL